jgi:tight adherence protein B
MDSEKIINIIIMVAVFGLFFSLWGICVFLWLAKYLMRLDIVQRRLGVNKKLESKESKVLRLWCDSQKDSLKEKTVKKNNLKQRLEKLRSEAGWKLSVRMILIRLVALIALAFTIVFLITQEVMFGVVAAGTVFLVSYTFLRKSINNHTALFERQLADALGIASRALRAGHPLIGTFQLISEEIGDPLGSIFSKICQEQTLGLDLKDSIRKVAQTAYNSELKLFATAVAIQFQSGGNLADLMDRLASVIRSRIRLNRRVRVVTAQTQFSKRVLISLPFILFFILSMLHPEYMDPFYETVQGKYLLMSAAMSVLFGAWAMNRLSRSFN